MFKLEPNPTFEKCVSGFDPGAPESGLTLVFRHKTAEEYQAWTASFAGEPLATRMLDVIDGWKDAPCEFSQEVLKTAFNNYPAMPLAAFHAYGESLFGVARKN